MYPFRLAAIFTIWLRSRLYASSTPHSSCRIPAAFLLRSQMVKMAASLKGYTASQLSFHMASVYLIHELSCMPYVSPGNIPGRVAELEKQAGQFVLPERRERSYPRSVKARPQKYAVQKANKKCQSGLTDWH